MYAELLSHYFANMSAKQVYIFPTELRPILRVFYQLRNSKKLEILPKPFPVQHVRKLIVSKLLSDLVWLLKMEM